MSASAKTVVKVVYVLPGEQYLQHAALQQGAMVEKAIHTSGLSKLRTDIDLSRNKIGIYSRPVELVDALQDSDRVKIYQLLIADPKELRKQRAEESTKEWRIIEKMLIERLFLIC